ncbi:hypothetical protein T440DRAFT_463133 [Plenodomus tracheiphilus IPT5]|uniref:AB hydrolase-1 domain-containing protein n=1 Tax=Plenodomus tracheiphilus IPT5 TaxID=1408161 RepID=A0A6A7BQJ1_9PLEO|nr:hypothetical protein T440DRAFT_463133 [Plenodomus tracheiphilus IPT5]
MVALQRIFVKAYWTLAGIGIAWAVCVGLLVVPVVQRHALYAHKFQTSFWHNVSNPEEFGFAKGQVQPFLLETADHEKLFCWHVIPLDVYLENENELVMAAGSGEVAEELKGTLGEKLMSRDQESRVVVNFHGNAGHIAQSTRPSTYRSLTSIPKTHLLTCSYRGFGTSTLNNAPHLPTEPGLITDAISLLSYLHTTLHHPPPRTVLLGQSLGTAVTAAAALYFADPTSQFLPPSLPPPSALQLHYQEQEKEEEHETNPPNNNYASIILISPFRSLPFLLKTYKISGIIPILKPLAGYPRIAKLVEARILDTWDTAARLGALVKFATATFTATATATSTSTSTSTSNTNSDSDHHLRLTLIHARNDQDITFRESEALYTPLQSEILAWEGASATEERRSIHGGERVKRGAFAYRKVEVEREGGSGGSGGSVRVELEVVRYGGHNEVAGWNAVGLAVRRAFAR